jgi:hypothetical protein
MKVERTFAALALGLILSSPIVAVAVYLVGDPGLAIWIAAAAPLAAFLHSKLPAPIDGALRRRPVPSVLFALVSLVAVLQSARVGMFMADPNAKQLSAIPGDRFSSTHSCLSAYTGALARANAGEDIYAPMSASEKSAFAPLDPDEDKYQYAPPFLLVPAALKAIFRSFAGLRAAFYLLVGGLFALGLLAVARALDERESLIALLLIPVVWASFPTLITFQIGNVHFAIIALSMLAALSFAKDKDLAGGALLGTAIIFKVFPGVLLIPLLIKRKSRAVLATLGTILIWCGVALTVLGPQPYQDFFRSQLGALASGAAFAQHQTTLVYLAANHSPYALGLKLAQLGLPLDSPMIGTALMWIFGLTVLVLAALSAKRSGASGLRTDLALLNLGALCAAFAPMTYTSVGSLWLLTLLASDIRGKKGRLALLVASWLLLAIFVPVILLSIVSQGIAIGLGIWVVIGRRAPEASADRSIAAATAGVGGAVMGVQ